MKKIIKGLSILVASSALCAGIALFSGCSNGYNGTYTGSYHYVNAYNQTYGLVVQVTVENNIITKVTDITNTDVDRYQEGKTWTTVSPGWLDYYITAYNANWFGGDPLGDIVPEYNEKDSLVNGEEIEAIMPTSWYGWSNADAAVWPTYENWLLQKFVGKSVAEILDITVYYSSYGEPYATKGGYNDELLSSGLLITNSTQGSGRLMLAVQNALKSK